MGPAKTPRSDALFGTFLQDVREIMESHPRIFKKRYYQFDYVVGEEEGYSLVSEPNIFPGNLKREIMQAFNLRLNQDKRPGRSRVKRNRNNHLKIF
ncbi:MAG: hypothetical protein Q8927_10265 [Bacteroidota bacterium]|nr:hypothetical protein [Bacteroidota bacterium]MDP4216576.1 hypothetical protein [Bacteroidota bacterium]MDP4245040.1 hypothetical protein [Bacteroidota bacterium]MDP4254760.1 hypothetical protein [Bacteroidota bacterium]MDP4259867.1 hypothetical protein [Bacteroidota bacterium]